MTLNYNAPVNYAAPASDKPQSEFWMNPGMSIPGPDGKPRFVTAFGTGMDPYKPRKTNTSNAEFNQLMADRNALEEHLLNLARETLAPGEEMDVALTVRIRRVKASDEAQTSNAGISSALSGLTAVKVA